MGGGLGLGGVARESSHRSCRLWSPSRVSSRGGSASPDGSRHLSRSRSWSLSRRADEDRQEEQSSLHFVSMVATLQSLNELPEAPSESCKIRGFCAAFEDDDQPASWWWFGGHTLGHVFEEGVEASSVSGVRSHCFYRCEEEGVTQARSLNRHVTELARLRSFDNLNRTDVILSSSEAEDMEAAMQSIVEATTWMDWWTFAMKSLAFQSSSDARFVCRLSLVGTRCQLLMAKTASTLWANLVLKRHDTVLAKVKDSISFESFMDLHNARLSNSTELFPADILEKAVERSSKVLHNEAIRKAEVQEKPQHKGMKLHFLQQSRQQPPPQQQSKWSCGSSSGKSSFFSAFSSSSSSKASSSSSRRWKGKRF